MSSRDKSPQFGLSDDKIDLLVRDLIKKRGTLKGRLTKFGTYINSFDLDEATSQNKIDLKLRIEGATDLYREFNSIQSRIEESVSDSDLEHQLNQRQLFEDCYYSTLSQAELLLNRCGSTSGSGEIGICSKTCRNSSLKSIKLPVITLKTFDGSFESWLEFKHSFQSLVNDSDELSDTQKFHYLRSSLKGSAALVIDSIEFTPDNYPIAWELLCQRYNNNRLLIHNHVNAIFNVPKLNKESCASLRNLSDTILKNLRALKVLGEPVDSWDTLIIHIIVTKLDKTTEREWEQHRGSVLASKDSKLKVDDLIKFLKNRADMLETLQSSHNTQSKDVKNNVKSLATTSHSKCNVSNIKPQESRRFTPRKCFKCNGNHQLYACTSFINSDLDSKLKLLRDHNLCLNCMKNNNHTAEFCKYGGCRRCSLKHNSLIHADNLNQSPGDIKTTDDTKSSLTMHTTFDDKRQSMSDDGSSAVPAFNDSARQVLLSTALVQVRTRRNDYLLANALLDNASERSFVTEPFAKKLGLKHIQSTHEIRGVGNSVTQCTKSCDIEIKSRISTYTTKLHCYVLPQISSPLPAMHYERAKLRIPNCVQLADPHFLNSRPIDILIGAETFWELLTVGNIRLPNGPYLQNTCLGWIISGPIVLNTRNDSIIQCNFSQSIDTQLRQFWEVEELPRDRDTRTDAERACEDLFTRTTTRNDEGRFIVSIPLKSSADLLGESVSQAERRFLALEKRLQRTPAYKNLHADFNVDDMITGSDDKDKLIELCKETSSTLQQGCFPLRKWIFNFDAEPAMTSLSGANKQITGENTHHKTLGIGWQNDSDEFYFNTEFTPDINQPMTKRIILSYASQIFDPLGILSPFILTAKMLLQRLWLLKLDWDESVPVDIARAWNRFLESLSVLNTIRVPRYVMNSHTTRSELHIFTDASQVGYGATVFVRTLNADNKTVNVRLLCSKGKVAPLKTLSIPRLELLGALIGARLYDKVRKSLRCDFDHIMFWTDSTIVLGWLRMPPRLLKTFVQNRTIEIHDLTTELPWRYVSGKENPADLLSRGVVDLEELSSSKLWWEGPAFLRDSEFDCNAVSPFYTQEDQSSLPETKDSDVTALVAQDISNPEDKSIIDLERFSQFKRLRRSTAYALRFIFNSRNKLNKRSGVLSVDELGEAGKLLARLSQLESFPVEYKSIVNNRALNQKHNLSKLNLFVDDDKLLRVGGRLDNSSEFDYNKKHPILLSGKHYFTLLLFRHEHQTLLHAAPQALLYHIRETWWPIAGRNLARKIFHECVLCKRLRGQTLTPLMGNLPSERITPTFPFSRCGVDYAGPVNILNRKGRGATTTKAYICIFICFVTRAVHLELVTDLTTKAYCLTLNRFIARRGKPAEIWSDNQRAFIGLKNEFAQFLERCSPEIIEYANEQKINFKFIIPYAAHVGGGWERGVRSCKYHLRRVVGNAHLTYEEFSTMLSQIEAILNSRPLSPMSSDPNDLQPLSPGHFLVGRLLTAPACDNLEDTPTHRLDRYQRVEQLRQHFWRRWSKEYISEMQVRTKWRENTDDLKPDTMVLIKDDNLPPLRWHLGRLVRNIEMA